MSSLIIFGIDLSGPRNVADTCVAVFEAHGDSLHFQRAVHGANDLQIYNLISGSGKDEQVVIGIDAPLSYNQGGGDRPSDRQLRRLASEKGRLGVMPPTLIRMVYLTLRGVALTRMLENLQPRFPLKIVEVHPGAALLLRGAAPADVAAFKREPAARTRLLDWMEGAGLEGLPRMQDTSDHFVAACSAALAAWQWSLGQSAWCAPARPPEHPYDFAC